MNKRILIIGGGFLQTFAIRKAKELGYFTIVIDKNPEAVGFKYADKYAVIDISDEKKCLQYAESESIDGVLTAATDYGILSTALISQEKNLKGLNYHTANIIKNKRKVRENLFLNKVDDMDQFYELDDNQNLQDFKRKIKYPVFVKPVDGAGSRGVSRASNEKELVSAIDFAFNNSLSRKIIIEDYIDGEEVGVESIVFDGEVYVLGIINKKMTSPPNYAELGHSVPSKLDINEKIIEIVKKAITSLGINFGAVNMDILVSETNKIFIVDIGARMGGNLISSHIIPNSTNYDYLSNLIKATMGDRFEKPSIELVKPIASKILALDPGEIVEVPKLFDIEKEYNVDIYFTKQVGDVINSYRNNLDGCGYVVSYGEDVEEAEHRAETVKNLINNTIIRKNKER